MTGHSVTVVREPLRFPSVGSRARARNTWDEAAQPITQRGHFSIELQQQDRLLTSQTVKTGHISSASSVHVLVRPGAEAIRGLSGWCGAAAHSLIGSRAACTNGYADHAQHASSRTVRRQLASPWASPAGAHRQERINPAESVENSNDRRREAPFAAHAPAPESHDDRAAGTCAPSLVSWPNWPQSESECFAYSCLRLSP